MNKVYLIGNLTRDPELTSTPNGFNYCRFSIAVSRRFANQEGTRETDFFNVIAWRGLGDTAHKYLRKGSKVCVAGAIQINQYTGNDGTKKTSVDVVADDIEFLTPKGSVSSDSDYGDEETPAPKPKKKAKSIQELEPVEDDGDLPF